VEQLYFEYSLRRKEKINQKFVLKISCQL